MMVLLFENGRLGNQFFQYVAARELFPTAKLIIFGMESIRSCVNDQFLVNAFVINSAISNMLARLGYERIIRFLVRIRLTGFVREHYNSGMSTIIYKRGLLRNLVCFDGYFQAEKYSSLQSKFIPILNKNVQDRCTKWMELQAPGSANNWYFVHVRRGDYVRWPDQRFPAVVPWSWYAEQIGSIRSGNPGAFFFICTDDRPYVQEMVSDQLPHKICTGTEVEDLLVMTLCKGGGVLSASTFAWWGGFFVKRENPSAILIAPKYWAGWKKMEWFPSSIETTWIEYHNVLVQKSSKQNVIP